VASAFISQAHTQTVHIQSIIHNTIAMSSKKPYDLVGFEPVSSEPEAPQPPE
jgi:hypothetical protein